MTALNAGDTFPSDVVFSHVPATPENSSLTSCGVPQPYNASEQWASRKVVLFGVPGAFTPGCSVRHLPGFLEHLHDIKAKGVDVVAVVAMNDAWVMDAWKKANGVRDDDILFLSDPDTKFGTSLGWSNAGRLSRFAMIVDHGKVVYAEKEPGREVTVSGADAVLAKL